MSNHILTELDFYDDNYVLIGIHTTLKKHRLAYFLNRELNILLEVPDNNRLEEIQNYFYSHIYNDKNNHCKYFLIQNTSVEIIKKGTGLFEEEEKITYFLPEKKKVDYFFKIEGFSYNKLYDIISNIENIPQVSTAYEIYKQEINDKNKPKLIF